MIYSEKYPVGTGVRIVSAEALAVFKRDWKYLHPISNEQLGFAGLSDRVRKVGFYHGGDVLYELEKAPGIWHESCLEELSSK